MRTSWVAWIVIIFSQTSLAREICSNRYMDLMIAYTRRDPFSLKSKIGIEIEGSVHPKLNYKDIAQFVRAELVTVDPSSSFRDLGNQKYEVSYYKPGIGMKIWTIENDVSILTRGTPFEISSPILEDQEDFEVFKAMISSLKKLDVQAEPQSAGVHIHVDFDDARLGEMAFLAGLYSEIEKEAKMAFAMTRTRSLHAANTSSPLSDIIQNKIIYEKNSTHIKDLLDAQGRQHSLNLTAYDKYKTVEFRLFNSTFDLEAIELMIDFSKKLVQAVRTQNPKLMAYLMRNDEPIKLQKIAEILEMKIVQPEARIILAKLLVESQHHLKPTSSQADVPPPYLRNLITLLVSIAVVNEISDQAHKLLQ